MASLIMYRHPMGSKVTRPDIQDALDTLGIADTANTLDRTDTGDRLDTADKLDE